VAVARAHEEAAPRNGCAFLGGLTDRDDAEVLTLERRGWLHPDLANRGQEPMHDEGDERIAIRRAGKA
jgi:hypothetical protein